MLYKREGGEVTWRKQSEKRERMEQKRENSQTRVSVGEKGRGKRERTVRDRRVCCTKERESSKRENRKESVCRKERGVKQRILLEESMSVGERERGRERESSQKRECLWERESRGQVKEIGQ